LRDDNADRISLSSSIWNYHRPVYPTKPARIGCLLVPASVIAILLTGSGAVATAVFIVAGLAYLLGIWSQRGAYATRSIVSFRSGIFSGRREVPVAQVTDIVVEPVPILGEVLGDLGDITVKFTSGFHVFEGVPRAHAVALDLLTWRDQATAPSRNDEPTS